MAPRARTARLGAAAASIAVAAAATTTVTVNWGQVVRPLKTTPGFQTVVNPLTTRESPVHDAVFGAIASLGASYQRFVPWLPYPKLGIAELEPPSTGNAVCGFVNSGGKGNPWTATIDCASRGGGTIAGVTFADYGAPTGFCGSLVSNASCTSSVAKAVVAAACVGRPSCTLTSNDETFGPSPCAGSRLAVQVACATPVPVATYWDFTLLDEGMSDFLAAAGNRSQIPNFSTIPNWLFAGTPRVLYPDDPLGETWNYESGTALADATLTALGDYYGRLVAHYVEGGFKDEAGVFIPGYNYNISIWEVLNEIEGEHHMTPQTYTAVYDAIVAGIRRWAPTGSANMKFMGLALEGSGNIAYVECVRAGRKGRAGGREGVREDTWRGTRRGQLLRRTVCASDERSTCGHPYHPPSSLRPSRRPSSAHGPRAATSSTPPTTRPARPSTSSRSTTTPAPPATAASTGALWTRALSPSLTLQGTN
jgi:hypothetical protein